ncbi:MAG: T9SS type A sorting domain-containing protein, partial [Bacteroidales bacterium]|nr:T9SS type A sorting domain-containing protein [Bacteroidales bacterium]
PDGVDAPGTPDSLFDLRPNPTHGTVTVTTRHASSATLTLRNAAGQEVLHHTARRQAFSIDVDKLPAGVYFATLVTPQGTATRKLVIE